MTRRLSVHYVSMLWLGGVAASLPLTDITAQETQPSAIAPLTSGSRSSSATTLSIRAGVGHSDNLTRIGSEQQQESSFQTLGLDVDWTKATRRFVARVGGELAVRRYSKANELDNDTQPWGSLDSRLEMLIVPERFSWEFEQHFGQIRRDVFAPIGPQNREWVSVVSTGPRFALPLGRRTSLVAMATTSERLYEVRTDLESRTTGATVGITRAVSPVARVDLSYQYAENDFKGPFSSYEFENVALTYSKTLASGRVEASIGEGKLEREGLSRSLNVLNFAWGRQIASRTTFNTWAARELTDSGQLFSSGGGRFRGGSLFGSLGNITRANSITDVRSRDVVLSENPMERRSVGIGLEYDGERTSWSLAMSVIEDRFQVSSMFDNEGAYAAISINRGLTQQWDSTLTLSAWRQQYASSLETFDDYRARFVASRRVGRRMNLDLTFERNGRSGSDSMYDENVYLGTLRYRISR